MDAQSGGATVITTATGDTKVSSIKRKRTQLESRILTQHKTQLSLISTLQSLAFPHIVTYLDLSSNLLSSFSPNNSSKPFVPTPPLPPAPEIPKLPLEMTHHSTPHDASLLATDSASFMSFERTQKVDLRNESGGVGCGSPLLVVRSMVAESLLQRVPFRPIDSSTVLRKLENDQNATEADRAALRELGGGEETGPILAVEMALRAISEENHGGVELEEFVVGGKCTVMVLNIDRSKLIKELPESSQLFYNSSEFSENKGGNSSSNGSCFGMGGGVGSKAMPPGDMWMGGMVGPRGMMMGPRGLMMGPRGMMPRLLMNSMASPMVPYPQKMRNEEDEMKDLEALLNKKSFLEMQKSKTGEELLDLIHRPTAKETAVAAKFKTKGGSQLKEYCSALTKEDCWRQSSSFIACDKVHFRRIIAPHTDVSQGDCSFLDTCRHMKTCKYVHYELDPTPDVPPLMMGSAALPPPKPLKPQRAEYCSEVELGESQWINCDIRSFKMEILGQFGVIMADPPWDIHMELPYGTMADDEMRNLNVPVLQTDGLIFLWVTGRAMELGRECLELWGYKRVEEIIWVKTNQLQRIIRTGRTGHWLNHSKEHCLVGIKGNPEVNRNIDTDVTVAEVRETSRKPDEMYSLLERISPRTRKLELFARMHNTHAGWMSLGNQLDGVRLVDEGLRARFKAAYPDVAVQPASPPRASVMEVDSTQQFDDTSPGVAYASDKKPIANNTSVAA